MRTGPGGVTLSYDPLLRLYETSAGRRFAYDGGNIVAEYDSGNVLKARHVFGPGMDEVLVSYDSSGNRSWLIADERGSIVAKTDAGGTATAIRGYDEYGNPSGGDVGRFGYTGQAWLPEPGIAYYKARMYAPTLGRFMQTDPIGYGDGMNLYAYVGGDPVNFVDPWGLYWVCYSVRVASGWSYGPEGQTFSDGYSYDQCHYFDDGPGVGGDGGLGGGGVGGGGVQLPPLPALPQTTKMPTLCQRAFLKRQLASRGLPTSQIDQLKFVSGLDGNANAATRAAFPYAVAVTQGATVYVQPERFNEVANFQSPIGFEEAYHSGQFALWGAGTFYDSYGVMSVAALLLGLGARGGNLTEQFAEGASKAMHSDYQSAGCPK